MTQQPAQVQLRTQVIEAGACTLCGACSGLCPYLRPFQGRIAVADDCSLVEGRCAAFCPRTGINMDSLYQQAFGVPYTAEALGPVRSVLMTRSTDSNVSGRAQYGGTVTALVCDALERGEVASAVLTRTVDGVPRGVRVSSRDEVLECAGSNYLAAPTLEALDGTGGEGGGGPVALVGTPCQVMGFRKTLDSPLGPGNGAKERSLAIGLFCTWALSHRFLDVLRDLVPSDEIRKMDVPPPPAEQFEVYAGNGPVSLPLDEVRPYILDGCAVCPDMTAELADISVGSAEGVPGWNTVLVRTERGERLVQQAVDAGLLEVRDLPPENLGHLQESAETKRRRAFQRLSEEGDDPSDLGYLRVSAEAVHRVLGDA